MKKVFSLGVLLLIAPIFSVSATEVSATQLSSVDTIWILIGAFLVFAMQPGFAMVETGLTRAKNAGNIVMKNFMDFCLGSIAFWFIGFGLMYGTDISGIIGKVDLLSTQYLSQPTGAGFPASAYLIFQTVFCATAATIVSGAMAERTKFSAYCIYSFVISAVIYPISGHWAWGNGWLMEMGFHDFAGSAVVHMVGGFAALMGANFVGPRIGKYNEDGSVNAIRGHSMPLAVLGVFILWFGWFGFNGASTLSASGNTTLNTIGGIFLNTNLAAASAAMVAMCITWIRYGKPDVSMTLNGGLAGLVAITAGCDSVNPEGAMAIGLIAGVVIVYSVEFFDKILKIDDPVGAISVHGICGLTGTILTGFFSLEAGLLYTGDITLLTNQIIGVFAIAGYVLIASGLLFYILKKTVGIRVSEKEEIQGLDSEEYGYLSVHPDYIPVIENQQLVDTYIPFQDAVAVEHRQIDWSTSSRENKLTKISIITSQLRLELLQDALEKVGITGMTVTNVMGYGLQKGHIEVYRGSNVKAQLLPKVQVDMIISKIPVATIVKTASEVLYTGHYGDGKIFIYDVLDVIKIRTNERGYDALQDKPIL